MIFEMSKITKGKEMKKALLCIGNPMRGDDDVGNETGRIVEANLKDWRIFYGQDVPENEFGALREFGPDIIVVVDAMSGFKDGAIEFFDLSNERDYIYSTHNLPTPVLLSYLRKICPKTLFLGISVLLENVLDFKEGLSENAKKTCIAPIVSSRKSAKVILKMWDRKYNTTADAVVIEGPLAGGHLGFSYDELHELGADTMASKNYKREKYDKHTN